MIYIVIVLAIALLWFIGLTIYYKFKKKEREAIFEVFVNAVERTFKVKVAFDERKKQWRFYVGNKVFGRK